MTIALLDQRHVLHQLLLRYSPADPTEEGKRLQFLSFVETHKNCLERAHLAAHITGSAWVMDRTGTQVLLTHHKKLNKWLQLGGHADGESNILSVAGREAREESGLDGLRPLSENIFDLDIHPIPARGSEPAHLHYDVRFIFQTTGSETFVVSAESFALAWVPLSRLSGLTQDDSLLRMAMKGRRLMNKVGNGTRS